MSSSQTNITLDASFETSEQELNTKYGTEREIFTRMVCKLRHHPVETLQILGFWVWLDREVCVQQTALMNTVSKLPDTLLNEAAEESLMCMRCVEKDKYFIVNNDDSIQELGFLPNLIGRKITLQNFHDNRMAVVYGTLKMLNRTCVRAFSDILLKYENKYCFGFDPLSRLQTNFLDKEMGFFTMKGYENSIFSIPIYRDTGLFELVVPGTVSLDAPPIFPDKNNNQFVWLEKRRWSFDALSMLRNSKNNHFWTKPLEDEWSVQKPVVSSGETGHPRKSVGAPCPFPGGDNDQKGKGLKGESTSLDAPDPFLGGDSDQKGEGQKGESSLDAPPVSSGGEDDEWRAAWLLNEEIGAEVGGKYGPLCTVVEEEYYDDSPAKRTIFFTFPNGYPPSESAIKDFFTMKFGNCIEEFHMKKVVSCHNQPLFAQLVARTAWTAHQIAGDAKQKLKYTIDGQAVLARKAI